MATLSITVPDAIAAHITADMCAYNGYQEQIPDVNNPGTFTDNPQTPGQFVKECVKNYILSCCRAYEAAKAAEDARIIAANAAGSELTLGD